MMKYISECDVIIYDMHAGNPRDIDYALSGKYQLELISVSIKEIQFRK